MFDWVLSELRTAVKNIHAGAFAEESHYIKDYLQGLKKKLALRIYSKIENGIVNAPSQEKLCLILDYLDSKQSKGDSSINQLEKEHYVLDRYPNSIFNSLMVCKKGNLFLVMSEQALKCLNDAQLEKIQEHCDILTAPIYLIEEIGGGSARCMMAENFLPKK